MLTNKYLQEIVEKLKPLKPYKIILFGSFASGKQDEESDLDILVILDSDKIAKSFEDKLKIKIKVRQSVYDLSKKVPIDLIVYTRAEYDILFQNKNSFIREIENNGKVLYERTDQVLA